MCVYVCVCVCVCDIGYLCFLQCPNDQKHLGNRDKEVFLLFIRSLSLHLFILSLFLFYRTI